MAGAEGISGPGSSFVATEAVQILDQALPGSWRHQSKSRKTLSPETAVVLTYLDHSCLSTPGQQTLKPQYAQTQRTNLWFTFPASFAVRSYSVTQLRLVETKQSQ